jgi:hypothetical protein
MIDLRQMHRGKANPPGAPAGAQISPRTKQEFIDNGRASIDDEKAAYCLQFPTQIHFPLF